MAEFERLSPRTVNSAGTFGSVATNASATIGQFCAPATGQVIGARIINASANAVTSGSTAGSSVTISIYKTASAAGSVVASFNGSGTTIATNASRAMTLNTGTSANLRFTAGDVFLVEYTGGAANNASNAGLFVSLEYVGGYETGSAPSAGTGPA